MNYKLTMKIKETVSMYMMYAFAAVTDDPKFREEI